MQNFIQHIKNNKFNIFIIICYIIITSAAVFYHELWRDEAQAWCIVRDLNFVDIFNIARYEGHPILWYLLLLPFAKLGINVVSMQIISLIAVLTSVIFFVFKSPFNKLQKVLIIFSAGMLYYLPVIARNYSLIPVLLFLLAYFYPKRDERPYLYSILIILLSNTHILMLGFCLTACACFFFEDIKKHFKPTVLSGLNFLFLLFSFYNTANQNIVVHNYFYVNNNGILTLLNSISYYLINSFVIFSQNINNIIIYTAFLFTLFALFKLNKKLFIIFSVSLIYMILIFYKIWFGGIAYQKVYLLMLIFIFCYWIITEEKTRKIEGSNLNPDLNIFKKLCSNIEKYFEKIINLLPHYTAYSLSSFKCSLFKVAAQLLNISFYILFIISFFITPICIYNEIKYNFSGSKQVANYIRTHLNNEDTFIIKGYLFTFSPISAYLPDKHFYSTGKESYITFYDFSIKNKYNKSPIKEPQNIKYYIAQFDQPLFSEMGYKQIYASDLVVLSTKRTPEIYRIYIKE